MNRTMRSKAMPSIIFLNIFSSTWRRYKQQKKTQNRTENYQKPTKENKIRDRKKLTGSLLVRKAASHETRISYVRNNGKAK